ncbi:hypothetical protein GCT13_41565 [Paraburkholderia sp. CNPSo 3157]|uniref:Amino acid permease/ SLC12A domain-containing protein n=1 Tax=Paraburkholderia franconis TaxID=2654983 RepID=A0A7X1NK19_9BURK|nr:hypothetical protein [Paraburkholderia franconis]MPW23091.1 hypothetical protein [Paraburkholderia franconis]
MRSPQLSREGVKRTILLDVKKLGAACYARFKRTSSKGVPRAAVLGSTVIGLLVTASNFFAPSEVFTFLLSGSGAIALLVYPVMAVSQLRMRTALSKSGAQIECMMWLFPHLTWAVIILISAVLLAVVLLPERCYEVGSTAGLAAAIAAIGALRSKQTATDPFNVPATRGE